MLCVHDIAFTVKVVAMLIIMTIIDINIQCHTVICCLLLMGSLILMGLLLQFTDRIDPFSFLLGSDSIRSSCTEHAE